MNGRSQSNDKSPRAELRAFLTRLRIWNNRMKLIGSASRYMKELRDRAGQRGCAPRKKTPLTMHRTRSGTIVRTTNVRDQKYPASQEQHVRERDIGEDDVQQAIEYRLIGDVAGIETNLNKEFFDPEIFGRVIEHCSRIENANAHGVLASRTISIPSGC